MWAMPPNTAPPRGIFDVHPTLRQAQGPPFDRLRDHGWGGRFAAYAFSGRLLAGGWFRESGVPSSRPPAGNASRWAVARDSNRRKMRDHEKRKCPDSKRI